MKVFTDKRIEKQRNLEVVFLLQLQKKTRSVLSSTLQTNWGCTDGTSFSKESQRRMIKNAFAGAADKLIKHKSGSSGDK
jgi:hypothetical protein